MEEKRLPVKEKKAWSEPEVIVYGPIKDVTQWLGFGDHTELFGGWRETPIDWGLDGSG
jgi:hypothetical protein